MSYLRHPSSLSGIPPRRNGLDADHVLGRQTVLGLPVALAKALRVHQWAKNLLLFVPLLLGHSFGTLPVLAAIAAFFCLSLTASATYILNDPLDLEPARVHLNKRKRAFAAGDLSVTTGIGISFLMTATALSTALYLPWRLLIYLLLYLAATIAYSLALKRIVLVDVVVLSSLYAMRMLAGARSHTDTHFPLACCILDLSFS